MEHFFAFKQSGLITNLDSRTKLGIWFVYTLAVIIVKPSHLSKWIVWAGILGGMFLISELPFKWILFRLSTLSPLVVLGLIGATLTNDVESFMLVMVKMILCAGASIWLSMVSSISQLLNTLRMFKLPTELLIIVSFMLRYIFLLADEARRMGIAYLSRCPRKIGFKDMVYLGKLTSSLIIRTILRSRRIYFAMLARCFDGTFKSIYHHEIQRADFIVMGAFILIVVVTFWWS